MRLLKSVGLPKLPNKRALRVAFCATLLLSLCSLIAHAQTAGTASIQGTVSDPTGAAVPNAKVTVTNTDTATSRITSTDGAGLFSLPNIPVGAYSLTVEAAGFSGFTQMGVLEVGNNVQINPTLRVGSSTSTLRFRPPASSCRPRPAASSRSSTNGASQNSPSTDVRLPSSFSSLAVPSTLLPTTSTAAKPTLTRP